MKTFRLPLLLLALAGCLASCENELRLRPGDSAPLLVMNGLLQPDSAVSVRLTRSMSATEPLTECPAVDDARVLLYVDGRLHETLAPAGKGYYRSPSGFRPAAGQHIALTASDGRLPDIGAETPMPDTVGIERAWLSDIRKKTEYSYEQETGPDGQTHNDTTSYITYYDFKLNITLNDPAGARDYYRLVLRKTEYQYGYALSVSIGFDLKEVFRPGSADDFVGSGDPSYFYGEFDDAPFDGRTFTLHLSMSYSEQFHPDGTPYDPDDRPDELQVELQTVTRDYYQYLRTRGMADNSSMMNDLFAEPVRIYNNIKGGIGILGAYSSSTRTLPLVFE